MNIEINSNDPNQSTHLISRQEVEIELTNRKNLLTETTPINDANQVLSQPIIDLNWESRYYYGHLVATCGRFVAYALKQQTGEDIVYVFYKQVDFRSVINPPFSGDVHDLAFSFSDDVLLACVDQASHLRIYRIEKTDEPNELQHTLILFVDLQYSSIQSPPTLSWCCFIPDSNDSEDNDTYTIMSVTRGSSVEVFNVAIASQSCISENMLTLNQIENGRLTYEDHSGNVTCVCFSPDGSALGTGTDKGEIKFFSINFDQPTTCRCLHLWVPHEGRALSSLFFLDDHKNLTQETQLWRYAVTGCDHNRELKVWSCTNWTCLQVIRFQYSSIDSAFQPPLPILKASIDLTSRFLVLSDIHSASMYVLTIYQDADNNRAHFSSINAFTSMTSPSLSFAITAANQIIHDLSDVVSYGVKMFSIHTKCFQELLLVFKTNRFMSVNTIDLENDEMLEDFRSQPYIAHLRNGDLPLLSAVSNNLEPVVDDLITLPQFTIDDLLTPSGGTARSLLASHDGLLVSTLSTNATTTTKPRPSNDPLHGLLLGNTTAFDTVTAPPTSTTTKESSQSPLDLADKEVAASMSCPMTYPLQFEALPNDDPDDVDTVFLPIKSNDEDEPVNGSQDLLWTKESPRKGLNASAREDLDDYSDPTETSDKDDDSTADEEDLLHKRIKRRSGRSPNSSQIGLNADSLHEIRQLTRLLAELRSNSSSDGVFPSANNDTKLEQCCQRLEQLTNKVDRWISFEQSSIVSRPSRPSPNAAPVEIVSTSESSSTISDAHYDRLEAILIDKMQTYIQAAMQSVFEPYRDMKDNLHKDLAAKLLATDTVIKQTITQIFRSKTMIDSLSQLISPAIQSRISTSYRDAFNQFVIPSFEKAATNMFQQTNDVFKRGTKEYLQEMIEYGRQQQRSLIQQREQMMNEIRKEVTQLNKEFEKKNQELANILRTEITQHMTANLSVMIRDITRSILREEISSTFRELFTIQKTEISTLLRQSAATPKPVLSRTTTPLPTPASTVISSPIQPISSTDVKQQHVLKLLRQHQFNQAFEFVLSASDLNLVLYLCQTIRPTDLFAIQPCPLQTPVLLSLVQQLAADLNTNQELKYSYLHEALISLDLSHPSVRDYAQAVLRDLSQKLHTYIQTNPSASITKRFQLLFMASQGLVQKIGQQRATPSLK